MSYDTGNSFLKMNRSGTEQMVPNYFKPWDNGNSVVDDNGNHCIATSGCQELVLLVVGMTPHSSSGRDAIAAMESGGGDSFLGLCNDSLDSEILWLDGMIVIINLTSIFNFQ